jgi:hypothetical protein
MTEALREIAVVKEYADFLAFARACMAQLGIAFETLDDVSGVQSGYSAKVIGPNPCKNFGPVSFISIFGALALKLVAVEDPEAMALLRHRLVPRQRDPRSKRKGAAQA